MKEILLIKVWILLLLFVFSLQAFGEVVQSPNEAGKSRVISEKSAMLWLKHMSAAFEKLSYRGVFVYQQGSYLETLAVTRDASKGRNRERVIHLDGSFREMVMSESGLTYATAGKEARSIKYGSLMPMAGKFTDSFSEAYYKVRYASQRTDRIAGRKAAVIVIAPIDQYRYGYQLWIDTESSLMLKSVMFDGLGKIIERLQFTQIDVDVKLSFEELAAMDQGDVKSNQLVNIDFSSEAGGTWGWEAGWVPDGFSVKSAVQRLSPDSEDKVDAVIYSDGIANFSVFVEPEKSRVLSQESDSIGVMVAVSKVFRREKSYFHVTVVGAVPLGVAERVAASVRPIRKPLERLKKRSKE
ncbi:MAG: MucB/RseB C-terminal domain-containing protein [Candidatus Endonucleobacter bathymodioli]|uniref:MucB/RseB C-terminal domain-containing protein n=1 Tax=Candidatus Endonucleibacter bathymodioli TaxID=539814 RepID=A0AA90NYN2_9GAMM|nr:MucB/RseB C-terminal domain-containing protein [Candidatus Endonucleobacter bathymodioli]